jgi:uncharacterized protein YdiU (UPF0061 family)
MMRDKLGLFGEDQNDLKLINNLLNWMESNQADYTNTFCQLMGINFNEGIYISNDFLDLVKQWKKRSKMHNSSNEKQLKLMKENNPIVIPRNHKIEEALTSAGKGSLEEMNKLLKVLSDPYGNQKNISAFQKPSKDNKNYQTFCGT